MLQNHYDYATTVSAKDAYSAVLVRMPYAEMLDEKGRTRYFKIDNYINTELVKGYYNCPDNLYEAYKDCERLGEPVPAESVVHIIEYTLFAPTLVVKFDDVSC